MSTQTEPKRIGDLVLREWDQRLSRTNGTFRQSSGSTADFTIGHVCVLSGGKYIPATGTTFSGILLANIDDLATATDKTNQPFLTQGPAVISKDQLVWDAGADASDQTAILAAMLALGIQVVDEPDSQSSVEDA